MTDTLTKHTPGPWHVCQYGYIYGMVPDPEESARLGGPVTKSQTVCSLQVGHAGVRQADVSLIAAAPDLLEELKEAVEAMAAMDSWPGWKEADYTQADVRYRLIKSMNAARAAIAKAEG